MVRHHQLSGASAADTVESSFLSCYPRGLVRGEVVVGSVPTCSLLSQLPRFLSLPLDLDVPAGFDLALVLPQDQIAKAVATPTRVRALAVGIWRDPSRSMKLLHNPEIGGQLALVTIAQGFTVDRDEPEFSVRLLPVFSS